MSIAITKNRAIAMLLLAVLLVSLCFMFLPTAAYAADSTRTGTAVDVSQGNRNSYSSSGSGEDVSGLVASIQHEIAPNVTTEDLVGRIEGKGNDVVTLLQTVGKYVCIASFVICCMLILIGIIGNHRLLAGGTIGLILSGIAYAGIVCGREIVNWIAAWAIS